MTRCPHCFYEVPKDKVAFLCTGSCPETPDPQLTRYHGAPKLGRSLTIIDRPNDARTWSLPTSATCWKCGGSTIECCRECHYPFPAEWRQGEALCVAFAGPINTGKTNTIATMVHALERLGADQGWPISHASSASRLTFKEVYQEPLFRNRSILPPTSPAGNADAKQRDPLILGLGKMGGFGRQPRYLVVRDVAGEDLEGSATPDNLSYFSRADLVVILFDPTQIQEVRDVVADRMPVNQRGGNPLAVLENVFRLIGNGNPMLAVTIAKLDSLWEVGRSGGLSDAAGAAGSKLALAMANSGSAMRSEPFGPQSPGELDASLALLDLEVRSLLLGHLRAQGMVHATTSRRRAKTAFFAVSALGYPPNSQGLSPHGIAPYRVLDPLFWLLRSRRWI